MGDPNKPVYFASAQSGKGWFSEHPNQHVFHSDNIRVRIDEEPEHPDSTCQFDSYNQENNEFSINDGTKIKTLTRLDIEILAKDINAVNIQIHGDVNMKVLGDWYVHHEGNKHETHIGTHYVKHIGETVIYEEGDTIIKKEGNLQSFLDGTLTETITQEYIGTVQQDFTENILGRKQQKIGQDIERFFGGDVETTIQKGEVKRVLESSNLFVGQDNIINVIGDTNFNCAGHWINNVNKNISFTAKTGNIDLTTQGEFEITDEAGNITAVGYSNLGTMGNIRLTSTFGNIGLHTIENKDIADLETDYTCIAWNPGYLKQMGAIASLVPGFDEESILKPAAPPTDLAGFFQWLLKAAMYDGFPTFLPCKMIMQNPNIVPPSGTWISKFRSIDDDWNNITNENYWKLISKVIGNIDLRSWSGDINIITQGTLGNAGNINILANNKYGALPGYECGNINQVANTPFRIYSDPRDLFLDSHITKFTTGKFAWFSSANGPQKSAPPITIKPLNPVQAILQLLGVPFEFGFTQEDSNGGGCMKCITDVITQCALDLGGFSILPWVISEQIFLQAPEHHKFNAAYGSLMHKDECCPGSVSLLKQESNGYGHACEVFGLDEIYGGTNYSFGNIIQHGVGSFDVHVGKNAQIFADTGKWKFGVNTKIETGHVPPSKGLNPIEAILGESPLAVPGQVCEPVVKKATRKYFNEFDKQKFNNYSSTYFGFVETGVYMLPLMPLGCFGFDIGYLDVKVPNLVFALGGFQLKISKLFNPVTQPYKINEDDLLRYQYGLESISATAKTAAEPAEASVVSNDPTGLAEAKPVMLKASRPVMMSEASEEPEEEMTEEDMHCPGCDIVTGDGDECTCDKCCPDCGLAKMDCECMEKNTDKILSALNNSWKIQFGPEGFQTVTSGCTQFCKLKDQLPNTAAALSLAVPVVQVLGKLIPGIGEFVYQAAKMLPNMVVPDWNDLYHNTDYGLSMYNKNTFKAWMPTSTITSGGIISWPSGLPILWTINKMGLPNIAGIADGLLSLGSVMDPMGTVTKLITEDLPGAVATIEANTSNGIALPKPFGEAISMPNVVSGSVGLFPGGYAGGTFDLFSSSEDHKGIWAEVKSLLPVLPPFGWDIRSEAYILKCGVKEKLSMTLLPPSLPHGEVTVDILDETFAMTVGGIAPPKWILTIAGKEIFNFPAGIVGLLGNFLVSAILDLIS
jgi:hypothetical protein